MKRHPVKTVIIGVGRWGQHIARHLGTISELSGYVIRANPERSAWVSEQFPSAKRLSLEEILSDSSIEAAVVSTPIASHASIARHLLEGGKHVLVEKPLATTAREAYDLAETAAAHNLLLMTGYIFLYHPVYAELKRLLKAAPIKNVECVWRKYGTFNEPIEMNLLTHHLALAYDFLGMPQSGSYRKGASIKSSCDRIDTRLAYDGFDFTSSIDRASDQKEHLIRVHFADTSSLLWTNTDLVRTEPDGTSVLVYHNEQEPLLNELEVFLLGIRDSTPPVTAGTFGARVLDIHELLIED